MSRPSATVDLTSDTPTVRPSDIRRSDVWTWLRAERDRAAAWLLIVAGAVAVLSCWIGVSGTPFVADQLAYLASGGIGGLFLLALGLALLVSADHHDEWRKLDRIEQALRQQAGQEPLGEEAETARRWAEGRKQGMAVLGVGAVTGAVIIAIGWDRAATTGHNGVSAQGITMSIAGLLVAVASTAAYLLPSRRRLMGRRARLLRGFLAGGDTDVTLTAPETVVTAEGLTRYHRAGCRAVDGLATQTMAPARLDPRLIPCELCGAGPTPPTVDQPRGTF